MKITVVGFGKQLFKIRGFTPIPFFLLCLVYVRIELTLFLSGLLLIGLGEILRITSVGYLGISSRKTDNAGADKLVINGPYCFVRNPIYLGNMLIYLGFPVLSNVFFPVFPAVILVFFMVVYYLIVRYEESILQTKFGKEYDTYLLNVPRFWPFLFTARVSSSSHIFNSEKAFHSEKTTLLILIFSLILIIIRNYTV